MSESLAIALPFYARLDYLELALESVLAQEDPHWTLRVVDDSHEKQARALVERRRDERIRYVPNPGNLGMVQCWNRCLDQAESDLVTLLHADDLLLPNYVGTMRRLAAEHPRPVALFCANSTIDAHGRPSRTLQDGIKRVFVPHGKGDLVLHGEHGLRALMRGNFIVCPTLCWRRAVLGERRFSPQWRQVQDLELMARLLLEGESLAGSRGIAYAYRRHEEMATARQTETLLRFAEEYRLFDEIAARCREHGWRSAARVSRRKTIVRLHLVWRIVRELAALRPSAAGRTLGFLLGAGHSPRAT